MDDEERRYAEQIERLIAEVEQNRGQNPEMDALVDEIYRCRALLAEVERDNGGRGQG